MRAILDKLVALHGMPAVLRELADVTRTRYVPNVSEHAKPVLVRCAEDLERTAGRMWEHVTINGEESDT